MNESHEYECALTGMTSMGDPSDRDNDEMHDLPVGWTRIRMTRRQFNPKWVMIQQIKHGTTEGMLQQVPTHLREAQSYAVSIQVEAQFHSLEQDTPKYINDVDDVLYVSDDGEILESLNEIREMLGLPEVTEGFGFGEEEDEDEDEDEGVAQINESGDLPQTGDVILAEDEEEPV